MRPWLLGSLDENNVQGYGGTPVNVNGYMPDFIFNVGAAGAVFPALGSYYVAVDSGRDPFTGEVARRASYTLRSWINDVKPPLVKVLTTRCLGRASDASSSSVTDAKSGVDPLSLLLLYRRPQIAARSFDPRRASRCSRSRTTRPLSGRAPKFMTASSPPTSRRRRTSSTTGRRGMPNTNFLGTRFDVRREAAVVTWLDADQGRVRAVQGAA